MRPRKSRPTRFRRLAYVAAFVLATVTAAALLSYRAEPPPRNPDDLCAIFLEKRSWYRSTRRSAETWKVPEAVQMAIIHQESGFRGNARPPRRKILWIFPGPRLSSAYGYAQAIDATWKEFQVSTGRKHAERHRFEDVAHFVGWYGDQIHRLTGIAKDDALRLYLAYHEGPAGYRRGSYKSKSWLQNVARRVERRAARYQRQYEDCAKQLSQNRSWTVWLGVLALMGVLWLLLRRRKTRRRNRSRRQRKR